MTNINWNGGALHARVSNIAEHALLVGDEFSLKIRELLLSLSVVVELEDWDQEDGEQSKNQNEEPQHIHIGRDTESKLSQRIRLEYIIVLHIVFLLFGGLLFLLLAVDDESTLFLEFLFIKKRLLQITCSVLTR